MLAQRRSAHAVYWRTGMSLLALIAIASLLVGSGPDVRPLPALHDGIVVNGPGIFRQDEKLNITGHVILRNLTLDLRAPIQVAAGATLELREVQLQISDPPDSANGTSNLICQGPAHIIIHHSTMRPSGGGHPIWSLRGKLEIDGFDTTNSEIHLDHVQAQISHLNLFELEISKASEVTANHLNLVFLSTHTGIRDHLEFSDIPTEKAFHKKMALGSEAAASLADTRVQIFLLYVHGSSQASLSRMERVQLALFPDCRGQFLLPHGKTGSNLAPAIFPEPGSSDCPFQLSLNNVNVDTWDVYAGGNADLTFDHSLIDELVANDHAKLTVRNSDLYADWLAVTGQAELRVENSTVGALRLASQRPDLATSEARLTGRSTATFSYVHFDCGIIANGEAQVKIEHPLVSPKYVHRSERAVVNISQNTTP